jgi:hypothetical protein
MKESKIHPIFDYFNTLSNERIQCKICAKIYTKPTHHCIKQHFSKKHHEYWLKIRDDKSIRKDYNISSNVNSLPTYVHSVPTSSNVNSLPLKDHSRRPEILTAIKKPEIPTANVLNYFNNDNISEITFKEVSVNNFTAKEIKLVYK